MDAYDRGRAAWPDVALDRDAFEAHCRAHDASDEHATDLYLACACALGVDAAIAAFDRVFLREVPLYIARIDASPAVATELQQVLREHLLVAEPGERPRIANYSGHGALGGWLRVVAIRRLRSLQRRERQAPSDEIVSKLIADESDPVLALAKARHGAQLAAAIKGAIAALSIRDRTLIKLHVLDGLTIDDLCGLYDVHRATVARWIVGLKRQLFDAVTQAMRAQLALDTSEVESLCAAVRSQLDVSLNGLFDRR
jgi:RNA polymerase sigma-70 factor (ECF subfamily)